MFSMKTFLSLLSHVFKLCHQTKLSLTICNEMDKEDTRKGKICNLLLSYLFLLQKLFLFPTNYVKNIFLNTELQLRKQDH